MRVPEAVAGGRGFDDSAVAHHLFEPSALNGPRQHPPPDVAVIVGVPARVQKDEVVAPTARARHLVLAKLHGKPRCDLAAAARALRLQLDPLTLPIKLVSDRHGLAAARARGLPKAPAIWRCVQRVEACGSIRAPVAGFTTPFARNARNPASRYATRDGGPPGAAKRLMRVAAL